MKQAFLIIAHKNLGQLQKLINALDSDLFDIYIHIDKKCKENISLTASKSKIYIYQEISVIWGTYSIVKAELLLFKEAQKNNYSYYHLISGEDYILTNIQNIYDFFNNSKKEFVLFTSEYITKKDMERVSYKHLILGKVRNGMPKKVDSFLFHLDDLYVTLQKIFRIKKKLYFKKYQRGSQWVSLTNDFVKYIVKNERVIEDAFNKTLIPDEMFVQTLIVNSEYFDNLYDYKNFNMPIQNYRYIDWKRGKPYVFKEEDFNELINCGYPFARKITFSDGLINMLDKHNKTR